MKNIKDYNLDELKEEFISLGEKAIEEITGETIDLIASRKN